MVNGTNEGDAMELGMVGNDEDMIALSPTTISGNQKESDLREIASEEMISLESEACWRPTFVWRAFNMLIKSFHKMGKSTSMDDDPGQQPQEPIVRSLNEYPEGYPRLAAFLDSDDNFMLYRKFGFLQARLLLHKQDELRALEKDLDLMDQHHLELYPSVLQSREKDEIVNKSDMVTRKILLAEIEIKFKEYVQLLITARDLAGLNKPPPQDYSSVKSYYDGRNPVANKESHIYLNEDLVSLKSGRESAWLDDSFAKFVRFISFRLDRYLFCSEDRLRKADPKTTGITLYSRDRVEFAISVLTAVIVLALLMVPVYLLWQLTRSPDKGVATGLVFSVLSVFTLVFAGVLALFTRAKRHEIFASSAAYCAVLVVFMSNVGQLSGKSGK